MKGKMGNQKTIKVKLTLKQTKCWDAFWDSLITHILFGGAMGGGKIVGDNNVVLTPFGFKKGKDLKVEDLINNPDGSVQKIIQIKPRITLPLWRVYFTDGTSTNVAEDHLWLSWRAEKSIKRNRNRISGEKSAEVVETKTLKEWLENGYTPQIPVCNELPFNVTTRELSAIDPYLLGVLLGDAHLGTLSLACHEDDKIYYRKVFGEEDFSYTTQGYIRIIGSLKKHIIQKLKDYSLWGTLSHTKFIPKRYKLSSITKRYEIVRGLMDTDGYSAPGKNGCYYYSTSKQLADDMAFILRSLGAVVTITNKIGSYKDKCGNKIYCKKCYCLYIKHREPDKLFKFKRKKQGYSRSSISKAVEKVEIDGNITGRCITVSNPNGLYITDDFVVTHNSYIGCLLLFRFAEWVIRKFNLTVTKYPIQIGFMGRYRAVDFNDTTLETWKRIIPPDQYRIRSQDKEIIIKDKVKYAFGGLDSQEAVSKFSSAEFAVVFIDQAEECDRDKIAVLMSRFRLQINGVPLPYKALFTANPANCFLKDEFVLGNDPKKVFIPALPRENPYLPDSYMASLKDAFKHRPELLLAYLEGSWDSLEGANIIIKDIWIRQASEVHLSYVGRPKRVFGVDVARYGDDRTVIYYLEGTDIKDEMIFGQKDTMYTAGKIHIWAQEKQPDMIGVDVIGLGAGVADRLREMGDNVLDFSSSEKAQNEEKFRNLRAESWWKTGRRFAEKDIKLTWDDPELRREMGSVSYLIKNGKIQAEPKEDIKKRLMKSPDKADAYIIGLHTLDHAVVNKKWAQLDAEEDAEALAGANRYTGV